MKRGVMVALAALMVLPAVKAVGQDRRTFQCGDEAGLGRDETRERAEGLMVFVLGQYRSRWDAQYAREQCEAYANGEPYDISCLAGKRDWEEIEAMVPEEFHELDRMGLGKRLGELREETPYSDAIDYCVSVGAVE